MPLTRPSPLSLSARDRGSLSLAIVSLLVTVLAVGT
jgi:hypothetical protein